MRQRFSWLVILALAACGPDSTVLVPVESEPEPDGPEPELAILDGSRDGGNPGFFWMPPIARWRSELPEVELDESLLPFLRVEICEWSEGACVGDPVQTFTSEGEGLERLRVIGTDDPDAFGSDWRPRRHFAVFWRTRKEDLDRDAIYRIRIMAGPAELGYADVDVFKRRREVRGADRDEFVLLRDGRTLPIRFVVTGELQGFGLVDSSGGRVLGGDDFSVFVPPGALSGEASISIEELPGNLDPSLDFASPAYSIVVTELESTGPNAAVVQKAGPERVLPAWTKVVHLEFPGLVKDIEERLGVAAFAEPCVSAALAPSSNPALAPGNPCGWTGQEVTHVSVEANQGGGTFDLTAFLNNVSPLTKVTFQVFREPTACNSDDLYFLTERDADSSGDTPVVFVHGWQFALDNCTKWREQFNPGEQGTALLRHLSGVETRIAFHRFTYPSFLSVANAGAALAAELSGRFGGRDDVVLVGHSMGGLVMRAALSQPGVEQMVARAITLGTPHLGSPLADPAYLRNAAAYLPIIGCPSPGQSPECSRLWASKIGLSQLNLATQGARDLRPPTRGGDFLAALPDPQTPRLFHSFAGQLQAIGDVAPCGFNPLVCQVLQLGVSLLVLDGVTSDGIVPIQSSLGLQGGQTYADRGVGYDHLELTEGNWQGDAFSFPDPILTRVAELVEEVLPAPSVGSFCSTTLDFNAGSSALPPGWDYTQVRGGPGLIRDRLEGAPTDGGGFVYYNGGVGGAGEVTFQWRANHAESYWGQHQRVRFGTGPNDDLFDFTLGNGTANYGANRLFARINTPTTPGPVNPAAIAFADYPYGDLEASITFTPAETRVLVTQGGATLLQETLSEGVPLDQIGYVEFWSYATTQNGNWADDLSITCTN